MNEKYRDVVTIGDPKNYGIEPWRLSKKGNRWCKMLGRVVVLMPQDGGHWRVWIKNGDREASANSTKPMSQLSAQDWASGFFFRMANEDRV